MRIKQSIMLLSLILCVSMVHGQKVQNLSKVQVLLDYHYNLGLIERGDLFDINRSHHKMYGNSLRLSLLYNLNTKVSLGAGIGLDRYENAGYNTLPLFLTCYYSPLSKLPRAYTYTNLGYAIDKSSTFTKGMLFDLGIGYRKMFRQHFGLNFQIGYNLKQFRDEVIWVDEQLNFTHGNYSQWRHSISFGFGFIF